MNQEEIAHGLVDEYLEYKDFAQCLKLYRRETLQNKGNKLNVEKQRVIDSMMEAVQHGDYPGFLQLWDVHISTLYGNMSPNILDQALRVEYIVNIYLATYPFRLEFVRKTGSPKAAAAVAARTMTIFKHYIDLRGYQAAQRNKDLQQYKSLHKIAFPPTHPAYKHLFSQDWKQMVTSTIRDFIHQQLAIKKSPKLITLINRARELSKQSEKREKKLLTMTRTLFDVSNDLLLSVEKGRQLDRGMVSSLRNKFNDLRVVMEESEASSSNANQSPRDNII